MLSRSRCLIVTALLSAPLACAPEGTSEPYGAGGSGGGTDAQDPDDPDGGGGSSSDGDDDPADADWMPTASDSGGEDDTGDAGEPECGNGVVEESELCDDGNDADFDGCDVDCAPSQGVVSFSAGGAHTCAVSFSGAVRCWGDDRYGQLGYATGAAAINVDSTPFDDDADVQIGEDVVQISAGSEHTCAVSSTGHVYCWGRNNDGQLGYGHTDDMGDEIGETPLSNGPVDLSEPATYVAAGTGTTCVVFKGGDVKCWGRGNFGELGQGDGFTGTIGAGDHPYQRPSQAPNIEIGAQFGDRMVSAGSGNHVCATATNDGLRCWGLGSFGQLGYGTTTTVGIFSTPDSVGDVPVPAAVVDVSVGSRHTCAVTSESGVRCWGHGSSGTLGYGNHNHLGDNEPPPAEDVDFGGFAQSVTVGDRFSCVRTFTDEARCWGANESGQLGYGSTDRIGDDEAPADWVGYGAVPVGVPVIAVDAGEAHVCALGNDAQMRCWGAGDDGRLGYGNEDDIGDDPEDVIAPVSVFRAAP